MRLIDIVPGGRHDTAARYYREAGEYPIGSDRWGFTQQRAWQELATLYETKERYREAVEALERWNIAEPCGTGAAESRSRKAFKIWELRLHYEPEEQVLGEIWTAVETGDPGLTSFGSSASNTARRIRELYGPDRLDGLQDKVDELLAGLPEASPSSRATMELKETLVRELDAQLKSLQQQGGQGAGAGKNP